MISNTCIAFAYGIVLAVIGSHNTSALAQVGTIERFQLLRSEMSISEREIFVVKVSIAPGVEIARHTHHGEEVGYLESGEVEMHVDGEANQKLKSGNAFIVKPGKIHSARNIGNSTAHVIVTYVVEKNRPLAVPAS